MNDVLKDFYSGNLFSLRDLEAELERWQEIVDDYRRDDVYSGDSYYQDALTNLEAYQKAIEEYDQYYAEDGTFLNPDNRLDLEE